MDVWYSDNGKQCGPVPSDSIKDLIQSKQILAHTLIWTASQKNWLPANQSVFKDAFACQSPVPPPLPTAAKPTPQIKNWFAWSLAFFPLALLVLNLFHFYEGFVYREIEPLYYLIIFAVNLILLVGDFIQISNAGYRLNKWLKCIFAFLVFYTPVYLFIRANKTDKKYVYACVSLGISIFIKVLTWRLYSS